MTDDTIFVFKTGLSAQQVAIPKMQVQVVEKNGMSIRINGLIVDCDFNKFIYIWQTRTGVVDLTYTD